MARTKFSRQNDQVMHLRSNKKCVTYRYMYMCNGILFGHKKSGRAAICDNMNEPGV
jgi:hypothetical protein